MNVDARATSTLLSEVPALAKAAEAVGFDALWQGETAHDPLLAQPLIAEHTSHLDFGTSITIAFARSPMVLAYDAWDISAQSQGRFMLGLGTQVKAHVERRFGMRWDSAVGRLREMILAIRVIWDCWQNGTPPNFRGQFYKITLMSPFFNPGPISTPSIPIFIAGVNVSLCRLAGEVADGFHLHPFHSVKFLREVTLPFIEEGAAKAGRTRSALQISGSVFTITNDKESDAVREQLAFYASTPSYRPVLECHGWGETGQKLSALASQGQWNNMKREITDEMLETFAIVAKPTHLGEKIFKRYHGVLDRVALYEPFRPGDDDRHWRELVEMIHSLSKQSL